MDMDEERRAREDICVCCIYNSQERRCSDILDIRERKECENKRDFEVRHKVSSAPSSCPEKTLNESNLTRSSLNSNKSTIPEENTSRVSLESNQSTIPEENTTLKNNRSMGPTQETTNQQQVQESTLQPEAPEDSTRLFDSNAMNTNEQSNKVTPRTSRPKSQKTLKQQEQSPQPVTPGEADKAYLFSPDHNFGAQTTDIFLATGTAAEGGNDQSNKTTPISSRPKTMKTSKQQEQSPQPVTPGEADRAYLFSPDHNFGAQTPGMTPLREGAGVSENVETNEQSNKTTPISSRPKTQKTPKQQEQSPQPVTPGEADRAYLFSPNQNFGAQTTGMTPLREGARVSENVENINERRGRTRGKRTRKQQVPQPQTQGEDSGHLLTTDSIFGPQTSDFSKLIERAGESQNDEAQLLHNLIMEIHALHRRNKNKIEEDKGKKEEKELREEDRFLMELEDKRLDELRKYAEELYKKKRLEKYDENNLDSSKKLKTTADKEKSSTANNLATISKNVLLTRPGKSNQEAEPFQ
ncbi:hypothetical protein O3M35_013023 [Rhynocoris fuscipes]|uniref:Uncharacterized protein n=1 Tax=Rhynocoris fuscipes TaxID=488301 RepID=A0AAW1CFW0_9HEMI